MPDGNILGETIFGEELDGENIGSLSSGESTPLPPPVVQVLPGGTGFLVEFNQDVTGASGFTFYRSGVAIAVFGYTSPTAATRRYYPQEAILLGDVITMDYTPGDIQDLAGNSLEAIDAEEVENNSEITGGGSGIGTTVYVRGPISVTPTKMGLDGSLQLFVGDVNMTHDFNIRQADGTPYVIPSNATAQIYVVDEATDEVLMNAGTGEIRDRDGGRVRGVFASSVCQKKGRKRLTIRLIYGSVTESFGPAILNVSRL